MTKSVVTYPRGSEWRKWDLHVHTPASIVQEYGSDTQDTWDSFIADLEALPPEIRVLGINDYLFLDGYCKVLGYQKMGRLKNLDLLLPVVEFRIDKFCGTESKLQKVNFHVIFSNELSPEVIQQQFLNLLKCKYNVLPGVEWEGVITKNVLIDLGKSIKATVPQEKQVEYGPDLVEGFNNLALRWEDITGLLNNSYLKNKYLTAIGKTEWESLKWNSNSIADKKTIINGVNIVFSASPTVAAFQKSKKALVESRVNDNLLHCSDAHNFSTCIAENTRKLGHCFTWIKSTPTFEGLRQILNEPDTRVFVGDTPPSLIHQKENPTKIIKQLEIRPVAGGSIVGETWFENITIPVNPELVAVIGNKGSGKSALADIIGLLGNSEQIADFSFLHKDKFKKSNKASHFEARLTWMNEKSFGWHKLSEDRDSVVVEKIKYIPQLYLEKICSEVATGANKMDSPFYRELENVIFSHIPENDRLNCQSLHELIDKRTAQTNLAISDLIVKLWELNKQIIRTEDELDGAYGARLKAELEVKYAELASIDARKPCWGKPLPDDAEFQPEMNAVVEQLNKAKSNFSHIEADILNVQSKLKMSVLRCAKLEEIKGKILRFEVQFSEFRKELQSELNDFALSFDDIIHYGSVNVTRIEAAIQCELVVEKEQKAFLDPSNPDGYVARQACLTKQMEILESQLAAPQREYQAYLDASKKWQVERQAISGENNANHPVMGTIQYYENALEALATSPARYTVLKELRFSLVAQIFKRKGDLRDLFQTFCSYAQASLQMHPLIVKEKSTIEFHVSIVEKGFIEFFLAFINQQKRGSFHGKEDAYGLLTGLLNETDFNSLDGIKNFLESLENLLIGTPDKVQNTVKSQLRQNVKIEDFYKYIYSLEYLKPEYSIRMDNKSLDELSAGERGTILLIFFFLVAKDKTPLVIDQPEDNLDNQTIYTKLVPCVNEAKKYRQIILVTHNPNLAVVCDADQVIFSCIDKSHGNKVTYKSGAIEDSIINSHIQDVLEGTRPAFDKRDDKYFKN